MDAKGSRTLVLKNRSLETLSLGRIKLEGNPHGPPAVLSNLKSLSIDCYQVYSENAISTIFRVPALQHLSSLSVSVIKEGENCDRLALCATGDDIVFTLKCDPECIEETWKDLTGYVKPIIQRVRIERWEVDGFNGLRLIELFAGSRTLEICHSLASHSHGRSLGHNWGAFVSRSPYRKKRFELLRAW